MFNKFSAIGAKRILAGIVVVIAMTLLRFEAAGGTSVLHVLYNSDMANSGVDPNASGKINGMLNRQGNANNQRLRLTLANLDPSATYQLMAYIGDDANPRNVADLTTDSKGGLAISYVQKCPGPSNPGGQPLPAVLDPISRIHQLDVVKDGNVILTGV